jgi:hypothetical protein
MVPFSELAWWWGRRGTNLPWFFPPCLSLLSSHLTIVTMALAYESCMWVSSKHKGVRPWGAARYNREECSAGSPPVCSAVICSSHWKTIPEQMASPLPPKSLFTLQKSQANSHLGNCFETTNSLIVTFKIQIKLSKRWNIHILTSLHRSHTP